jgi:peptidyl-prolyl cis-trans isomerase B (cyclophilin B)
MDASTIESEDGEEELAEEVDATDGEEETAEKADAEEEESTDTVVLDTSKELSGIHHVEIILKDYGTISVELDADSAPITVTNFIKLAQEDFYDGLTFHRIIDGFMMQGGDPLGNGTGGSKETIKGEFSSNGVENNLSHTRGAISMARSSAMDSASSQFFIVQTDSHYLDGEYAVFGYVTDGMDIVDEICEEAEPIDSNGLIADDAQPVIEDVKVID